MMEMGEKSKGDLLKDSIIKINAFCLYPMESNSTPN